ncbi:YscW family type III secretion system pilotin [Aeromonas tecta]|jgi:type III secretion system chaperone YscW|uniref:YscW family type III secretion system pilotin n=1 Tax=Aeromonas tecta TaxID=324617 RepID=UPI00068020A9|nr:YscW family type III secretion system pilotin [Aeromonas tecta]
MRYLLALVLFVMLPGCVTSQPVKPSTQQLKGEVHLSGALPHPAMVEIVVLSVIDGRALPVAAIQYEVAMLPLIFDLRLTPLQLAKGDIYIRTRLYFLGNSVVQAASQQKVFKDFNDRLIVIKLQPKNCYPQCH